MQPGSQLSSCYPTLPHGSRSDLVRPVLNVPCLHPYRHWEERVLEDPRRPGGPPHNLEGEFGDQALELSGHPAKRLGRFLHVSGAAGGGFFGAERAPPPSFIFFSSCSLLLCPSRV